MSATDIDGVKVTMLEFSDKSEIPNGQSAYGLTRIKVKRGGLGVGNIPCDDGNDDLSNRW